MAKKAIAVQGCTLTCTDGGSTIINSVPSVKVKAVGNGVYETPLSVTVSGATQGSCSGASGTGTINTSATKTKADGNLVMREGDSDLISVSGTLPGGGACSFSVTVTIQNAGQNKVNTE